MSAAPTCAQAARSLQVLAHLRCCCTQMRVRTRATDMLVLLLAVTSSHPHLSIWCGGRQRFWLILVWRAFLPDAAPSGRLSSC